MSVQFRQRTPGEYGKIAWKRKWMIILPAIAVTAAVSWVVLRLPNIYESSTLIVVKPSTLPTNVVATTSDDLTRQLASITQVVTSRSSLEPLVTKYDLYRAERLRGEPMESMIEIMRLAIKVEINTSRNDITNGFNITYRGRDPKATQSVTAELASKYISEQKTNQVNAGNSAKQFIDTQVEEVKKELEEIDHQRMDFMQKNQGSLPTEAASLIAQLNGLREQQKALMSEVGRLQDRRSGLSSQLALVRKQTEQARGEVAENLTDPHTTMAWAQLATRKADLESQLISLRETLTAKHPDVIAKQAELDSVKQEMAKMVDEWKERIKEKEEKLKNRPDMMAANYESEIKIVEGEITRQQGLLSENDKQIADVMKRINGVPGAEVALGALDRDYQTKKANYDQLLAQQQRITLGKNAAGAEQGEGIEVIDPANFPILPVAPKRFMLLGMALALGLAIGFAFAGVFEVPRLFTIQTSEDAAHYTHLPVLISVPELLTPKEVRTRPMRRRLVLALGVVVTLVMIPALAVALKATHIFERFVT